jgi:hypothetical protein
MKVHIDDRKIWISINLDEGTHWALPAEETQRFLRYGHQFGERERQIDVSGCLMVASIISTFSAILEMPQRRRNKVISQLRAALASEEDAK